MWMSLASSAVRVACALGKFAPETEILPRATQHDYASGSGVVICRTVAAMSLVSRLPTSGRLSVMVVTSPPRSHSTGLALIAAALRRRALALTLAPRLPPRMRPKRYRRSTRAYKRTYARDLRAPTGRWEFVITKRAPDGLILVGP